MEGQKKTASETTPSIDGWLWLPALGLGFGWVGLLSAVGSIRIGVVEIVQNNQLSDFPNARVFEKAVLALAVIYLILNIIVAIRFFKKRRNAPKLMVRFYIFGMLCSAFISLGAATALGAAVGWGRLILVCLLSIIWIAYFLRSERVKRTFVN